MDNTVGFFNTIYYIGGCKDLSEIHFLTLYFSLKINGPSGTNQFCQKFVSSRNRFLLIFKSSWEHGNLAKWTCQNAGAFC